MQIRSVILAAGEGRRTSNALHRICGRTVLEWAMAAVHAADPNPLIVKASGGEALVRAFESIGDAECILITYGDRPLILPGSVRMLVNYITETNQDAAVLYGVAEDPTDFRRILRNDYGEIKGIIGQLDATPEQRMIREIDASAYCFHRDLLLFALDHLDCGNNRHECFPTDIISIISNMGGKVAGVKGEVCEGMGVNNRSQMTQAARILRGRMNCVDSGTEHREGEP